MIDDPEWGDEIAIGSNADAGRAFTTFYNYVEAFHLASTSRPVAPLQQRGSRGANRSSGVPDEIRKCVFRGWLTLGAIKHLPIDENPDLATVATFWLPVQSYYAVHAFGLAALQAVSGSQNWPSPDQHSKFLQRVANELARLLPYPFNVACVGDPSNHVRSPVAWKNFEGTIDHATVTNTSNLSAVSNETCELLMAKALMTTRRDRLEARYSKKRKDSKRSRLHVSEKKNLERNLNQTSIFDLLYRLRMRTNYENPEMYVSSQGGQKAQIHYRNLRELTEKLCHHLEDVIDGHLPAGKLKRLNQEFAARSGGL